MTAVESQNLSPCRRASGLALNRRDAAAAAADKFVPLNAPWCSSARRLPHIMAHSCAAHSKCVVHCAGRCSSARRWGGCGLRTGGCHRSGACSPCCAAVLASTMQVPKKKPLEKDKFLLLNLAHPKSTTSQRSRSQASYVLRPAVGGHCTGICWRKPSLHCHCRERCTAH